ncbi:MAG: PIG-L family deacetylase [Gemmatimonadaceae bacterium]|nr:PIG-L family deacetylase [Gemmatimonadaceae bacterium]
MKKVLAISAHPDDETLGAGGTLLSASRDGGEVYWAVVTQPDVESHGEDIVSRAARQVEDAATAYGCKKHFRLGFPTARLDTVPQHDLMASLKATIEEVRPDTVLVVHGGDVHTDHHAVFTATMSVLKPFHQHSLGVQLIFAYETLSSTEAAPANPARAFVPNMFFDITPHMARKIEIMEIFGTEKQEELMPRGSSAIRALGRFRGATIGVEYAEAFQLIRSVPAAPGSTRSR